MSEFIAYPLEALNETYLNISHAHVSVNGISTQLLLLFQLNIAFDNHLNNVINLLGNEVRKNIALFPKPVDKNQ